LNNQESTEVGFADLNGASFKYEIRGDGPPLVLLYAGIADMRMWDSQIEAFAQHFRVVRYDMRGYGETAPVDGAFSHCSDLIGSPGP
jgi:pimeloyl-ACP methyl ester carboxylesterase